MNCPHSAICGDTPVYRASFRTREEALLVVDAALAYCPDPQLARLGLTEILVNCVEHGNLAFSFEEKSQALDAGDWLHKLAARMADPAFGCRVAQLSIYRTEYTVLFLICDEGAGFDWTRYQSLEPARTHHPNGRGIALARQLSFNRLDYAGDGSVVLAAIDIPFSSLEARRAGHPKST